MMAGMSSDAFRPLVVRVEQGPAGPLVGVVGELDTLTAPDLRSRLAEVVPDAGAVLVVDLSGVTFLSSAGLSALMEAHQRGVEVGCDVRLVVGESTARVFALTGLAETLRLYGSVAEAWG